MAVFSFNKLFVEALRLPLSACSFQLLSDVVDDRHPVATRTHRYFCGVVIVAPVVR